MSDQPEAIRWAYLLEREAAHHGATDYKHKAAAEMRRLHALNVELTENLEKKSSAIQRIWKERDELREVNGELLAALNCALDLHRHGVLVKYGVEMIRAAIAKAEGKV